MGENEFTFSDEIIASIISLVKVNGPDLKVPSCLNDISELKIFPIKVSF